MEPARLSFEGEAAPLLGRALAALGAIVCLISLFTVDFLAGFDAWEFFRYSDKWLLALELVTLGLIAVSLFVLPRVLAFLMVGAGFFLLGIVAFAFYVLPNEIGQHFDKGAGGYLSLLGALAIIAGGAISLRSPRAPFQGVSFARMPSFALQTGLPPPVETPAPAPVAAPAPPPDPATIQPEPEPESEPEPEPEPTPAAGWYPDPTGQARLRYWTGEAWSDETRA